MPAAEGPTLIRPLTTKTTAEEAVGTEAPGVREDLAGAAQASWEDLEVRRFLRPRTRWRWVVEEERDLRTTARSGIRARIPAAAPATLAQFLAPESTAAELRAAGSSSSTRARSWAPERLLPTVRRRSRPKTTEGAPAGRAARFWYSPIAEAWADLPPARPGGTAESLGRNRLRAQPSQAIVTDRARAAAAGR